MKTEIPAVNRYDTTHSVAKTKKKIMEGNK